MEYSYTSHLDWEKGQKKDHKMHLNLQLDLEDLLHVNGDVADTLLHHEQQARKEIFDMVLDAVVPGIIKNTPMDSTLPDGVLNTSISSKERGQHRIGHPKNNVGSIRYKGNIDVDFDVHGDRSMNAMQALRASQESVAHSITNSIINSLRNRFLGETEHKTAFESQTKNDKSTYYDAKVKKAA